MPYIRKEERGKFDDYLDKIKIIDTKGELEYCVTKLMKIYMSSRSPRYATLHDVVYAVMHSADEYRRRYLDKREDEAIGENGDV